MMTVDEFQQSLSTLRIEAYSLTDEDCDKQYYGIVHPSEVILWRVFVDNELWGSDALPFTPDDDAIQFDTNKCVPYFGEGSKYVAVRRWESYILWFSVNDYYESFDTQFVRDSRIVAFAEEYYAAALADADMISEARPLSKLLADELQAVLSKIYPNDPALPLYLLPERPNDSMGKILFRAVQKSIASGKLQPCQPPATYEEFQIGLDLPGVPEAVWQIGKVGADTAILFIQYPSFPLWVCGFEGIDL